MKTNRHMWKHVVKVTCHGQKPNRHRPVTLAQFLVNKRQGTVTMRPETAGTGAGKRPRYMKAVPPEERASQDEHADFSPSYWADQMHCPKCKMSQKKNSQVMRQLFIEMAWLRIDEVDISALDERIDLVWELAKDRMARRAAREATRAKWESEHDFDPGQVFWGNGPAGPRVDLPADAPFKAAPLAAWQDYARRMGMNVDGMTRHQIIATMTHVL